MVVTLTPGSGELARLALLQSVMFVLIAGGPGLAPAVAVAPRVSILPPQTLAAETHDQWLGVRASILVGNAAYP